ncbi:unnamed protein product [Arctia plantaginis]|uniref:Uncharacterized protein n=1 Tax=Arctia plantaginis TaxID=874455 RepID=A0A8S1BGS2_ARCPL|nr:unnamed protein product [Arctia plantaginis]
MYRTFIFLVVNINLLVESVPDFENINYNIIFNKPIAHYFGNFDVNQTFVVLRDKPFNLTLVDYTSAGAYCRSKRKSFSLTWYVEMIKVKGKWNSVIKVQRASEHMSLEWRCTFGRKNDPDQIITFKVRVKGVPKIEVTVGGLKLNNSLSESTEHTYDNIAYYWYEEGETIDLVCHNLNVGFLYIVYYDQNGTKLIETDRIMLQPPNFQKIMHVDDNNYILDCKYEMYDFHHGYAYRTIFKLRPEASSSNKQEDSLDVRMLKMALLKEYSQKKSQEGLDEALANLMKRKGPVKLQRVYSTKITVNNLKLIPTNVSEHLDKEDYQYNFFENQILKVSCEKNKDLPGHLQFGTDNNEHLKSRILEEVENNPWKRTITLDTKNLTLEHLRCEIIGYSTANIMLVLDTKELYILGLQTENVMYQYRNNSMTWIVDYQYSVNETLNLTCGARTESDLRWIFGSK